MLDEPLPPVSAPKPWTRPVTSLRSPRKSERSAFLQSPIIRKVRAAAERRLSVGLRIRASSGRVGMSDGALSLPVPRPRRPTDPESPRRPSAAQQETTRRRSCLAAPPRRPSRFSPEANHAEQDLSFSSQKTYADGTSQTEFARFVNEAATQTDLPDEAPSTSGRRKHEQETECGVVELEEVRLSTGSESRIEDFPAGFVALHPVERAPPEKDKESLLLINALEAKLLELHSSSRMRLASHIMRSL